MTHLTNTTLDRTRTIETTPTIDTRRRGRIRLFVVAGMLALATAASVFVALDTTVPTPVPAAPSYDGDWKDAFVRDTAHGSTRYSGDWKDTLITSPGGGGSPAYRGDWKDSFLPDADR